MPVVVPDLQNSFVKLLVDCGSSRGPHMTEAVVNACGLLAKPPPRMLFQEPLKLRDSVCWDRVYSYLVFDLSPQVRL
jgi:hypothetical protein